MYSKYSRIQQSINKSYQHIDEKKCTIFPNISAKLAVEDIKENGVFLGLNLTYSITSYIQEFAKCTTLTREDGLPNFFYSDVKDGYLSDGRVVPQALAVNPLECDAIKEIINDPILLQIIQQYLGYSPKRIRPLLRWSFVLEAPNHIRVQHHQTVIYHYDIYGFNSIYANFYLSDTDRYSGAHVMISKSHDRKHWKMLWVSVNQPDNAVHDYYGKENELIIEAEEGFGFVQDPLCYHKALAPIKKERLMLQLRFT